MLWANTKILHDSLNGHGFKVLTDSNLHFKLVTSKKSAADMSQFAKLNPYKFSIIPVLKLVSG